MKAFKIIVTGIVQGVGFRYHTAEKARSLGLDGTVENLPDRTVRIYVEGEDAEVVSFLEWCHEGPSAASVDKLDYEVIEASAYGSFEIKR